jgi:hypothetical protein
MTDDELIKQTKMAIRRLVKEIADLAKRDISEVEFYRGFLERVVLALAARGGAVWLLGDADALELQYEINLHETGLDEDQQGSRPHEMLLHETLLRGVGVAVAPHSAQGGSEQSGNPTEFLLIVEPLNIFGEIAGVVEIFQRPGASPATELGYVKFLGQVCELASDYHKNRHGDGRGGWGRV